MTLHTVHQPRPKGVLKALVLWFLNSRFFVGTVNPFRGLWRSYGLVHGIRAVMFLCENGVRARIQRRRLKILSEADIVARRKSDTVFVFGSGASLNELSDSEWQHIGQHDVIGLNYFVHQQWVDVSIHYVRELDLPFRQTGKYDGNAVVRSCRQFCDLLSRNSHYRDAIIFLQTDFLAEIGKTIIGRRMLPVGQPVCFYKGLRRDGLDSAPPARLAEGLPRQAGAIGGGISIARFFGWKRIVLIGVDLYNAQYFWLPSNVTRSDAEQAASDPHPTTKRGVIDIMENWSIALNKDGVSLEVYNPKSLLRECLSQFKWDDGLLVHSKGVE